MWPVIILIPGLFLAILLYAIVSGKGLDLGAWLLALLLFVGAADLLRRAYHAETLNHVDVGEGQLSTALWMAGPSLKVEYGAILAVRAPGHHDRLVSKVMGLSIARPAGNVHVFLREPRNLLVAPSTAIAFFDRPGLSQPASVICLQVEQPIAFMEELTAKLTVQEASL